jgi:hypothetical protein
MRVLRTVPNITPTVRLGVATAQAGPKHESDKFAVKG